MSEGSTVLEMLWNVPTPQATGITGAEAVEVVGDSVELCEECSAVLEQVGAERREFDRAGATGPVEDPLADDALQRRDLLADRRLGVAQALGRSSEGALGGDGVERHEQTHVEVA